MTPGPSTPLPAAPDERSRSHTHLKSEVHRRLLGSLDLAQARQLAPDELRRACQQRLDALLGEQRTPLSGTEKQRLLAEVMDEIFGLGPIEELMRDPAVTDILVNGPSEVYVERAGLLELTSATFRDDAHLIQVIQRIAAGIGRRIDESSPMLDARLSDGSRVNAIIPPLALDGPAMSVRRFSRIRIDSERMVELDSWRPEIAEFLRAAVKARANMVISGGTGSGKTTLLNLLSGWVPPSERVVTIEDAAELQLQGKHVVRLETRPPNIEGKGEVTQRELLRNTLRMRPDRIIIGEVRGGESLDMLQAMNTGHEGSMTTVHANSPRHALRRIENMVSMAGVGLSVDVVRDQIASTLDLLIQVQRLTGGRRRVVNVAEVTGMEQGVILLQDLFRFDQTGIDDAGHAAGRWVSCGVRPRLLERIEAEGGQLPPQLWQRKVIG